MEKTYDIAIVGAGPAGYEAAIRARQLGLTVALIESREMGGTCLNRGCIPTKAILHSSGLYRNAKSFEKFGLSTDSLSFDFAAIHRRKEQVVAQLRSGVEKLLAANGVDCYHGKGTLKSAKLIKFSGESETEELHADHILLATGCVPAVPPIPDADLPGVVTSDELLSLDTLPRRLVIIGGGVIGAEFATAFSDLDCEVTVIEAMPRILPTMDREISQNLSMILKKRGVRIHTSSKVERISEGSPLLCTFTEKKAEKQVEADCVLISVGRRPNTLGLFADNLPIQTSKGFIVTDEHHETSLRGVFAVGDVTGGIQLAHAASAQGIEAVEFIAEGKQTNPNRAIPSCVYTSPEIACVGLTADGAKEKGIAVTVGKALTTSLGKSVIENGERGFVKLVFEKDSAVLLGAQLMGERATDLIAGLVQAIEARLTAHQLVSVVRPHPTFSEAITEAAEDALGGAIHSVPRPTKK
ncbi:MAG: Dihydrolipoyl dehydrogenase [Oscillospiraceae bacterium]|jgi:dihydrolipoamide dehydrogenase